MKVSMMMSFEEYRSIISTFEALHRLQVTEVVMPDIEIERICAGIKEHERLVRDANLDVFANPTLFGIALKATT